MTWTKVLAVLGLAVAAGAEAPEKAADLFRTTQVWTVHLKFTADQWAAIEPKNAGGARPFGPGRPGGRFRPGDQLARGFMSGDRDGDGRLSRVEFRSLSETWFNTWSKGGDELTAEQLRSGAASFVPAPGEGPGLVGPQGGRNGMSAMAGINFEYVHADLEFQGREFRDVAVRYKGNNTYMMARDSLKKSFKIDLNKYIRGQRLAGVATLNLHNNITDVSWRNEVLSYQLFRDAGVPSPRTAYARVFVTVAGSHDRRYFGLYSIVENIDETFAEDRFATDEGAIWKPVTRELFAHLGDDWSAYNQMYDPKAKLTTAQKTRVIDFARFVTSASDEEFTAKAGGYLDLDEFARFMAVTVWLSNRDSILGMGQNYYLYLNANTNRFEFLPWDLDHSFGQFPMGGGQAASLSIDQPWQGRNRFLERVFNISEFRKRYLAKLAEFNSTILDPKVISRRAEEIGAAIRPAVAEESPSLLSRFDAGPMKTFVAARHQSVAEQLGGRQSTPGSFDPLAGLWSGFDANGDSRISRAEFSGGVEAWFDKWNANGDGHLTREEIGVGLSRTMPRPPMPPGPGPF